jgi:hypothetical protein
VRCEGLRGPFYFAHWDQGRMAKVLMQAKVEPEVKAWLLVSENRRTRLWTTLIGAFIPPQCPRNW